MDIGIRIKEVMDEKGVCASWLAKQLPCERSNVYNILRRKSMSVDLLSRISVLLDHDFYAELSEEWKANRKPLERD